MKVKISDIKINQGRREVSVEKTKELAGSIKVIGLLNPITIKKDNTLIAGYHRLKACQMLGMDDVECSVVDIEGLKAELAEIDENLIRNELHYVDRGEQLRRRKEIHEELHPETKKGAINQYTKVLKTETDFSETPSFVKDTSNKTGRSETVIKKELQIAQKVVPEVKEIIKEKDINVTDALKLSQMDREQQIKVAEVIKNNEAKDVKQAQTFIKKEELAKKLELAKTEEALIPEEDKIVVKLGDWWELGEHRIYCGDTSSPDFYDKIPKASLAFADPPYNANKAEWDNNFEWKHDWLSEKAEIVVVTPGIVSISDFFKKTSMPYLWSVACWINNGMTRGAMGFGNWIYSAVFSHGKIFRNSQDFFQISITIAGDSITHPSRKPDAYMVWIVDKFAEKNTVVVDPFLGSGTTLFAAQSHGCTCYGGEINPEYCEEVIIKWEKKTGKKAKKIV